jgi:hypothetical protein
MSLTDSPDLTYYEEGKPPEQEPSFLKQHWTKVVIGVLGVVLLVMLGTRMVSGSGSAQRTGDVAGQVVDMSGRPVQGVQVYVDGGQVETNTDTNGQFALEAVPAGSQYLVIGVTPEPPQFIAVEVPADGQADLGQLTLGAQ